MRSRCPCAALRLRAWRRTEANDVAVLRILQLLEPGTDKEVRRALGSDRIGSDRIGHARRAQVVDVFVCARIAGLDKHRSAC